LLPKLLLIGWYFLLYFLHPCQFFFNTFAVLANRRSVSSDRCEEAQLCHQYSNLHHKMQVNWQTLRTMEVQTEMWQKELRKPEARSERSIQSGDLQHAPTTPKSGSSLPM
jgi:hypothetical protein